MKICWDNLERLTYNPKKGRFNKNWDVYYYFEHCKNCNEPFLGLRNAQFCDRSCAFSGGFNVAKRPEVRRKISESQQGKNFISKDTGHIERLRQRMLGKENPMCSPESRRLISEKKRGLYGELNANYRGGYFTNNIPTYELYSGRLKTYQECRRNRDDSNILEVKCTYCGKWFIPTTRDIYNRLQGIDNNDRNRLYCSKTCKKECPMYRQQTKYKGKQGYLAREVQPQLRQLVLERDDYMCEKCGRIESLHCHHIKAVSIDPIESADMDNCVTLCKMCQIGRASCRERV